MLWMLIGVGTVELAVTHFLLALWWPALAAIVSALSPLGLAWLLRGVLAIPTSPVLVSDDDVLMRVGRFRRVVIPRDRITGVAIDTSGTGLEESDRLMLNLALLASANVILRVDPPIRVGHKPYGAVGHRLDDPEGFAAALAHQC